MVKTLTRRIKGETKRDGMALTHFGAQLANERIQGRDRVMTPDPVNL